MNVKSLFLAIITPLTFFALEAKSFEVQGKLGGEAILFSDEAKYSDQHNQYFSTMIEAEFFHAINDKQELKGKLFYRYDVNSESRTHGDIRELMFNHYEEDWELNIGIGKVFWGTTESRHLVDVINQVDWVESLDDEARLGQPMVQAKLIKEWGVLDLFILPYFREIQYLGNEGRPRINPVIQNNDAVFQSKSKQNKIDFAGRWSQTFDDLEIGISGFVGTQRTPLFKPEILPGGVELIPIYVQTAQIGIDAQYIYQDFLLKTEMLARESHQLDYSKHQSFAGVVGLEYTLVGAFDTVYDIGLITEYMYDDWEAITSFQNDLMVGIRFVMNDTQSTELLVGGITDLEDGSQFWSLEASRRIGDNWKAEVLARAVANVDDKNTISAYKQDDLFSFRLYYYF